MQELKTPFAYNMVETNQNIQYARRKQDGWNALLILGRLGHCNMLHTGIEKYLSLSGCVNCALLVPGRVEIINT